MEVSKRQTWNIIYEIKRRGLVKVIWDPHHEQRRLVELRQMIATSQDIINYNPGNFSILYHCNVYESVTFFNIHTTRITNITESISMYNKNRQ